MTPHPAHLMKKPCSPPVIQLMRCLWLLSLLSTLLFASTTFAQTAATTFSLAWEGNFFTSDTVSSTVFPSRRDPLNSLRNGVGPHSIPREGSIRLEADQHDGAVPAATDGASRFYGFRGGQLFGQIAGFRMCWGLTLLAGLCVLMVIRAGLSARATRIRAEERAEERVRIARELHDTLLQGVQGLMLRFHAAAQKVPADTESRAALDKALTAAEAIMIEGRKRLNSLRTAQLGDGELPTSLRKWGADLNIDGYVAYSVVRQGIPTTLAPPVASEVLYIAREAITNAFRHSQASEITVRLIYENKHFTVCCRDNGCGFRMQPVTDASKRGHWGMPGMAERAARLGGKLKVRSAAGEGTEVVVTLPRHRAYTRISRFTHLKQGLELGEARS